MVASGENVTSKAPPTVILAKKLKESRLIRATGITNVHMHGVCHPGEKAVRTCVILAKGLQEIEHSTISEHSLHPEDAPVERSVPQQSQPA